MPIKKEAGWEDFLLKGTNQQAKSFDGMTGETQTTEWQGAVKSPCQKEAKNGGEISRTKPHNQRGINPYIKSKPERGFTDNGNTGSQRTD